MILIVKKIREKAGPALSAIFLILVVFSLLPVVAEAQSGGFNLIVCDPAVPGQDCTFNHLVQLAQNVINALIILSTFLATAVFAYAGFILLTSGGNESAMTRAKTIFFKVLKGYLWILVAWLLIYTITRALLAPGFDFLGPPNP